MCHLQQESVASIAGARKIGEHRETIRSLKLADGKFRAAFEEYHQLDDEICRIEENVEFATDQEIDELKFKRAKLKDALYTAVSRAVPVAP